MRLCTQLHCSSASVQASLFCFHEGMEGCMSAGKTTLLDVISGRKTGKGVQGTITMNGAACGQMFRRISAYVPQVPPPTPLLLSIHSIISQPWPIGAWIPKNKDAAANRSGTWVFNLTQRDIHNSTCMPSACMPKSIRVAGTYAHEVLQRQHCVWFHSGWFTVPRTFHSLPPGGHICGNPDRPGDSQIPRRALCAQQRAEDAAQGEDPGGAGHFGAVESP